MDMSGQLADICLDIPIPLRCRRRAGGPLLPGSLPYVGLLDRQLVREREARAARRRQATRDGLGASAMREWGPQCCVGRRCGARFVPVVADGL